jgi:hypothetical protein
MEPVLLTVELMNNQDGTVLSYLRDRACGLARHGVPLSAVLSAINTARERGATDEEIVVAIAEGGRDAVHVIGNPNPPA